MSNLALDLAIGRLLRAAQDVIDQYDDNYEDNYESEVSYAAIQELREAAKQLKDTP